VANYFDEIKKGLNCQESEIDKSALDKYKITQFGHCSYAGSQSLIEFLPKKMKTVDIKGNVEATCAKDSIKAECKGKKIVICQATLECPANAEHKEGTYTMTCLAQNEKCPENPMTCAQDHAFDDLKEEYERAGYDMEQTDSSRQ